MEAVHGRGRSKDLRPGPGRRGRFEQGDWQAQGRRRLRLHGASKRREELPVEIRYGCINASKVFLNGKQVFSREEYHHGENFDQYVAKVTLKPGKNDLLLKVCQNDQKEPYAQVWQFKLRVCDATGGPVPVKIVPPAN